LLLENVSNQETKSVPKHPKNESLGTKPRFYGPELLIEADDANAIEEGEKITLMAWGNCVITKKEVGDDGKITLRGKMDLEDKDVKKTKKITWIANDPMLTVQVQLVEYDHLITKPKIEEDENIADFVNKNSKVEYFATAEGSIRDIAQGDIIQIERRGYFYVDKAAFGPGQSIVLNFIPDGKSKTMSVFTHKIDPSKLSKGTEEKGAVNKAAGKTAGGTAEGEPKELSKNELKKLAKKEQKK